jgi:hypothetical protein
VAEDRIDPREQIPEADLLEQQAPLDPQSLTDAETVTAIPEAPVDADEADRLEQHAPVLGGDEDDYPHEADGAEWS